MAIVVAVLAAATERGEAVALIDPLDEFDPGSAGATGLDLSRLLWVRGQAGGLGAPPGAARASITREWRDGTTGVERALKAMSLVLQAGNFGVVALDLAEVPVAVLRRLPFTTWLRLQRGIDGSQTVGFLATPEPIARSTHGATIHLDRGQRTAASGQVPRRFPARTVAARAIQPRRMRTDGGLDLTMTAVLE